MIKNRTEIILGISFLILSFVLYGVHIYIFNDFKFMVSDLTAQLAYIPIYVFITSLVIEKLLKHSEKIENLRRMNTLVGVFYSEMGNELIRKFLKYDLNLCRLKHELKSAADWNDNKCRYLKKVIKSYKSDLNKDINLNELKEFLLSKRDLMLQLMSNPNLMEHDTFTELLLSIFHIIEEFQSRGETDTFSIEDTAHITRDIERAYKIITAEWINYMIHLKKEYPYLHNLAVKTNPYLN